jgi:hypothetical protein
MNETHGPLRRTFGWIGGNLDTLVALGTAIVATVAGVFGKLTSDQFSNAALAVLGLIAFAIIRDRGMRDTLKSEITKLSLLISTKNQLEVIPANQIQLDFEDAMRGTDKWIYKGGGGTYLRAVTLKKMGEYAQKSRAPRRVKIQVINPNCVPVCEKYSMYRQSIASPRTENEEGKWDLIRVRQEAYATVLAACIFKTKFPFLEIELTVSDTFTLFRYDLSSQHIIITQEDRTAPALKAQAGSAYYNAYLHDLDWCFKQGIPVNIEGIPLNIVGVNCFETITRAQVKEIFKVIGLSDDAFLTDMCAGTIMIKALNAVNPYAK